MARFVVHEHHARRLHFDLRLEMDGTLVSWAVPKGPSLNPAEKRLAVRVEDHSLDYGTFEGTIPAGSYGAGEVLIWDKGTYAVVDGSLREGRLSLEFNGAKLKGAFSLFRLGNSPDQWLLVKKKDTFANPGFVLATVLPPSNHPPK